MLEHNQLNIFDFIDWSGELIQNDARAIYSFSVVEVDSKGRMLTEDKIISGKLIKGLVKNDVKYQCTKEELLSLVTKSTKLKRGKFAYNFYFNQNNKNWVGSIRFWNMKTKSNETIYEFIDRGVNYLKEKWDGEAIIYL